MSGGNTNHAVHTRTQKNAKLQLLPGPLPPRFVMCQDSGPAEVIESERGGGVGGRGGRGAQLEKQQRRLSRREPAVLGVAAASVWRGDSARPLQGKPAAAGASRPRLNIRSCSQALRLSCLRRHLWPRAATETPISVWSQDKQQQDNQQKKMY